MDLEQPSAKEIPLSSTAQPAVGIGWHGQVLLVFFKTFVEAFSSSDGTRLAQLFLPAHALWQHGRFIRSGDQFFAVAFDGQNLKLEQVPISQRTDMLSVFACDGIDFPLILSPHGDIRSADPNSSFFIKGLGRSVRPVSISADGATILVSTAAVQLYKLDVNAGRWQQIGSAPAGQAIPWPHPFPRSGRNLRSKFRGVFIDCAGRLNLVARRSDHVVTIVQRGGNLTTEEGGVHQAALSPQMISFKDIDGPPGTRFTLRVATWPDGRRAFLDSRGLLHLQPARASALQMTIVLTERGQLAGWASDGRIFGPKYYHGSDVSWDVGHFELLLRRFAEGTA
jgi:hypothetical protein